MSFYSDIQFIDSPSQANGTETVPKFYRIGQQLTSKKLRSHKVEKTVGQSFSTSPAHISFRSESGVCQVFSRSGTGENMHTQRRQSHGSDVGSDNKVNPNERGPKAACISSHGGRQ